jgi:2-hydroxychromene-2-carboxylate isomerase
MASADLHFYFDPVCPFAWMTSKWVRMVSAQRDYAVDWRFISLRELNADVDYDSHFPPDYEAGHTAGLRLLRVAARTRATLGREAVAPLYAALGARIFDSDPLASVIDDTGSDVRGTAAFLRPILAEAGLPASLAEALDDETLDPGIREETEEALSLTGRDVGTPIIHVDPPHGVAFFGPVISRLPSEEDALRLWEHVLGLARFAGFAELKRSLREQPQLRGLGVDDEAPGAVEDWHGGSRRTKR